MRKNAALGILVVWILTEAACAQPPSEQRAPGSQSPHQQREVTEQEALPETGVLYTWAPFSDVPMARTGGLSVSVVAEQSGDDEFPPYTLRVDTDEGRSARYPWPEGNPLQPDQLYLLDGYACSRRLIDVVVRSAAPEYADLPVFSYVRFLVDRETLELAASIPYDPSIEAALGIVPIQSVTAPDAPWPVFSVTCEGEKVESVTVRQGYGP